MQDQLTRIFDLKKVSYDLPSKSHEQEACFIEVKKAETKIIDAKQIAKVNGSLHVFAEQNKLPYGYFAKQIAKAAYEDSKNFLFFNFEENKGTYLNISERSIDFVYLFDSQYDPAIGTIDEVNLSYAESN